MRGGGESLWDRHRRQMMYPEEQGISTLLWRITSSFELRAKREHGHGCQLFKGDHMSKRAGKESKSVRENSRQGTAWGQPSALDKCFKQGKFTDNKNYHNEEAIWFN